MALTTVSNAGLGGSIDLTAKVTGTLPIANGGTNSTSTTYCDVTANVTGTLPAGNGGTGATTYTPGKILQVTYDNKASTTSTTNMASSGSWADVLSVAITPSATSSKILITAMISTGAGDYGDGACILRCLRDSTQIAGGTASGDRISTTSGRGNENQGANSNLNIPVVWMDSPSSTSALTYKVQFAARGGVSKSAYIGQSGADNDSAETQRTSCNLTLMEIAG